MTTRGTGRLRISEEWTASLLSGQKGIAHSSERVYQNVVAMFLDYSPTRATTA
jgi:hypothetical protein